MLTFNRQPVSPKIAIRLTWVGISAGMFVDPMRAEVAPTGMFAVHEISETKAAPVVDGGLRWVILTLRSDPLPLVTMSEGHFTPCGITARATSPDLESILGATSVKAAIGLRSFCDAKAGFSEPRLTIPRANAAKTPTNLLALMNGSYRKRLT